jgi:fumarate reductase subunit D
MYEHRSEKLLPRRKFYARVVRHGLAAVVTLTVCVGIGMAGYHYFEGMGWVDSYTNATMILSGMGPLDPIKTLAGRIFAGTYALFSGVAFLTTVGFFLLPALHRLLHKIHLESRKPPREE